MRRRSDHAKVSIRDHQCCRRSYNDVVQDQHEPLSFDIFELRSIVQRSGADPLGSLQMDGQHILLIILPGHSPRVSAPIHQGHPGSIRNAPAFLRTMV